MRPTAAVTPSYGDPPRSGARRIPVRRLLVLHDAECGLCRHVTAWLSRQPQLVPLEPVPAGSARARGLLPDLDHAATLEEITVVGDSGQVYRGPAAWIAVLWALADHRATAHRLCTPLGAGLARGMVLAAATWRGSRTGRGGRDARPGCGDDGCGTTD
ncbi:thiol-disulfide oxidoreductase DCC family protein [Streptomyces sp. TR06-5]|uniref:thiol-disulfide oxidoreductase DCC family protein n=1 Tax=unclassified Streptomyces TaxID=2593676 RepID=UPI00399FB57D